MSGTRITIKLGVAGVLIVLASLLADVIGFGTASGFGRSQMSGVVAGLVLLAVAVRRWRSNQSP